MPKFLYQYRDAEGDEAGIILAVSDRLSWQQLSNRVNDAHDYFINHLRTNDCNIEDCVAYIADAMGEDAQITSEFITEF